MGSGCFEDLGADSVQKLMQSCLNDMTSQTLRQCALHELLATLASTLIVVYLALGFRVRTFQIIARDSD